jgi:hypothetical protein
MSTFHYRIHGLRVSSEVALHEPLGPVEGPSDVLIVMGPPREPGGEVEGRVVAQLTSRDRVVYRLLRQRSGRYVFRAPSFCDLEISQDLRVIRCRLDPSADPALLPILLRGTATALLLELRGDLTLHASAVQVEGRALAFAGPSGSGKTTTAALFCAAGAGLVSDDVLHVEIDGHIAECSAGSSELRFRSSALSLLGDPSWILARRSLADGRVAVRPRKTDTGTVPLAAVVFPRPSRHAVDLTVHRVQPSDAFFLLASVPRVMGWTCPDVLRRKFIQTSRLAAEVLVFEARIPWGSWRPSLDLSIFDLVAGARV